MKAVALALLPAGASGHSQMYEPPSRGTGGLAIGTPNCAGGSCLWFNNGAFIGCPTNTWGEWNETLCPQGTIEPTNPLGHRSHGTIFFDKVAYCKENPEDCAIGEKEDFFTNVEKRNPWRAPGSAPVWNPCGLAGGGQVEGPHGTGGMAFFGYKQGHKGTEMAPLLKKTTWVAGSVVEVAWGITANHGGGYQYRLCRVEPNSDNVTAQVTEECFQRTPLDFVGNKSWLQYGDGMDPKNRTEFTAVRVREGVRPAGSTWTRNPIPACNDVPRLGGHNHKCSGPMFEPAAPGAWGFGPGSCASGVAPCTLQEAASRSIDYGIVDLVKVPEGLPEGDYVLGFRWDCEQLPQVWGNCGDVTIKAQGQSTKPFSPWTGCEQCCADMGPCANCTKCQDDKAGDCAYCWKPLPGFTFGAIPQYQCLGGEAPDGGPGVWRSGMPFVGVRWSPGCTKCWKEKGSCKASDRESLPAELVV